MTVGRISAICWTIFGVMSAAFLPLAGGFMTISALPAGPRLVLTILVVGVLWWAPFGYAMYLSMAVVRNGDRRLLKRGIPGTAKVLSARRTNTVIQAGEFDWQAPWVYKYRLRITIAGHAPYDTTCRICASGIAEGSTVRVAVSAHNKKRVTIDVGQGGHRGPAGAGAVSSRPVRVLTAGQAQVRVLPAQGPAAAEEWRIAALAQLGELHSKGVLNDSQFETEKARILA